MKAQTSAHWSRPEHTTRWSVLSLPVSAADSLGECSNEVCTFNAHLSHVIGTSTPYSSHGVGSQAFSVARLYIGPGDKSTSTLVYAGRGLNTYLAGRFSASRSAPPDHWEEVISLYILAVFGEIIVHRYTHFTDLVIEMAPTKVCINI